jgi:rhamnosyltransferase
MNKQNPETSIIIRTKNEEKYLEEILLTLKKQTYQNFEIIIVDDNSTDNTLKIAKKYNCKIVNIPKGKFSHPFSTNLGAKSSIGKYLVYLNGHSIPYSKKWLGNGLKNFKNKKRAGIYGPVVAHKKSTFTDKLLYNLLGYTIGFIKHKANKKSPFATTNCIIRRKLWEEYKFDENFNQGWGGEDTLWAHHFMDLGYFFIHEPKFRVRHSHHLKFKDFFWQLKNWRNMGPGKNIPEKQKRNF